MSAKNVAAGGDSGSRQQINVCQCSGRELARIVSSNARLPHGRSWRSYFVATSVATLSSLGVIRRLVTERDLALALRNFFAARGKDNACRRCHPPVVVVLPHRAGETKGRTAESDTQVRPKS